MPSSIYKCLSLIGERIIENKDYLTELDREIGDSDHGINMARGFKAVLEKVNPEESDIGAALKKAGMTLLSTVGGASGPLYGTAYMESGKALAGKTETYAQKISEGSDMISALDSACESAREGVEYTKTIIATKGRASYLGERSIGHQDPGATSAMITLEAIRDYLKGK